jgi:hypothetical protein
MQAVLQTRKRELNPERTETLGFELLSSEIFGDIGKQNGKAIPLEANSIRPISQEHCREIEHFTSTPAEHSLAARTAPI